MCLFMHFLLTLHALKPGCCPDHPFYCSRRLPWTSGCQTQPLLRCLIAAQSTWSAISSPNSSFAWSAATSPPPSHFFFFFNLCDLFSVLAVSSVFILFKKVAIHLSSVFDLLFLLFAPSWAVIHFPWLNCAYDSQIQSFCPNFSWALDSQLHLDGPGTPNLVCSQPFTHLYLVSARIKTSVFQNKQFMRFC